MFGAKRGRPHRGSNRALTTGTVSNSGALNHSATEETKNLTWRGRSAPRRHLKTALPDEARNLNRKTWFWSEVRPTGRGPWRRTKKADIETVSTAELQASAESQVWWRLKRTSFFSKKTMCMYLPQRFSRSNRPRQSPLLSHLHGEIYKIT